MNTSQRIVAEYIAMYQKRIDDYTVEINHLKQNPQSKIVGTDEYKRLGCLINFKNREIRKQRQWK